MQNKNKLESELELVSTLKMLAQAYEEISVLKMQKVRGSVLTTREFLDGLSEVFVDVKKNYGRELQRLIEKKQIKTHTSFTTQAQNGKTLSVFLSANSKFYGDIVRKVFNLFLKNISSKETDIMIIGKTGKEMMEQAEITKDYSYYEIPEDQVSLDDLKPIVDALSEYQTVEVYYGRFSNMVNQLPTVSNLSGQSILETDASGDEKVVPFAFEPSVEQILQFFENQVFVSMFKQTINEAELARLASRIRAMEEALGNIEEHEPRLRREARAYKRSVQSKKQIGVMTSVYYLRHNR